MLTRLGISEAEQTRMEVVSLLCMADRTHSQLKEMTPEKCGVRGQMRDFEPTLKKVSRWSIAASQLRVFCHLQVPVVILTTIMQSYRNNADEIEDEALLLDSVRRSSPIGRCEEKLSYWTVEGEVALPVFSSLPLIHLSLTRWPTTKSQISKQGAPCSRGCMCLKVGVDLCITFTICVAAINVY